MILVFLNPELGQPQPKTASGCNFNLEGNRALQSTSTKSESLGHQQADVVILSIGQH